VIGQEGVHLNLACYPFYHVQQSISFFSFLVYSINAAFGDTVMSGRIVCQHGGHFVFALAIPNSYCGRPHALDLASDPAHDPVLNPPGRSDDGTRNGICRFLQVRVQQRAGTTWNPCTWCREHDTDMSDRPPVRTHSPSSLEGWQASSLRCCRHARATFARTHALRLYR
jgi:hypothetical protein